MIITNKLYTEREINGKMYRSYTFFPKYAMFVRYEPETQKIYDTSGNMVLNFIAEDSSWQSVFSPFGYMNSYFVEYYNSTLWGDTFRLQNYADYYEFGLAKGIGYSYYAERPGWPMPYLWIGVRQAKIYDSVGVALYYDPTIKPVISYDAQSLTDSAYFNPSLQVRHPYSTIFQNTFFNFIDSVRLHGFYVGLAQDTIMPIIHPIFFEELSYTCKLNLQLNDSLMRKGYAFKYNIRAIDKGIIPQSTTKPGVNTYYSVKYHPSGIKNEEAKETDFNLSQNYPNPFNSETLISFTVPHNSIQSSKVTLKVFDLLGSVKEILYNGEMETGEHQIRFNAENLPSGIYFYELNIDGRRETKKMILQK